MAAHLNFDIARQGDTAIVTIFDVPKDADGNRFVRVHAKYETLSRGATASARRTIKGMAA